jgi:EmrB/QacA subfamily drug resistance transporter
LNETTVGTLRDVAPVSTIPEGYKWRVLSTVIFGIFMVILDTTVVNVSFQALRQEFGGNINDTQWILSIYVLAIGISTPLAGFLADRFGSKRMYLSGLGLFAFGSLLCGMAPSLNLLILARAIQGVGGGITMPIGMALLLQAFPPKEHGTALGIFGIAALVAPAIGPILGGFLVDQELWRAIFFINPPIGFVGIILGIRFLRDRRSPQRPSLDLPGIVSEVIGFGAILYGASLAATQGWNAPSTLLWFGVGIAGLVVFAVIELFVAKQPLLDLRLFSNRIFLNASVLGYVSTVALFGAEFLMPVYLQSLRGLSALSTGLVLLPMALTGGVMVTLSGRLYDRIGPRPLMVAGYSILMLNTWQLSQIRADTALPWIVMLLSLRGIALGLTVQTTFVTALSQVPRHDLARGSSLSNSTRQVIQSIGVAVLATVLASTISPDIQILQNQMLSTVRLKGSAAIGLCTPIASGLATKELAIEAAPLDHKSINGVSALTPQSATPPNSLRQRACDENVAGFERTYRITFYAAMIALVLGMMLPGWPKKWTGRGNGPDPAVMH